MPEHVISRGLDIPIKGAATGEVVVLEPPKAVAYSPTEFRGFIPRLAAREGDVVERGSPLMFHKSNPEIKLLSPVAGKVAEVRRGRRRLITDVVIECAGDGTISFKRWELSSLKGISREDAKNGLLAGGLWPTIRTRPLNQLANPETSPQSILIGAFETGPLQPGAEVLMSADDRDAMQAGTWVLKALTDGKVFLGHGPTAHPALTNLDGVEAHQFKGPHPAGDPTVQVNLIDPPRGANEVWWLRAWDVVLIGRLFLSGEFPAERIYAAVGAGAKTPRFVKTVLGAPLKHIVGEAIDDARWIRGSVLTGEAVDADRWAPFFARAVHVLPAKIERYTFGWALPALGKHSVHRAFLSGTLKPRGPYDMRPALHGGVRAMIPVGAYKKVICTPDIMAEFLFKAIITEDLEESLKLGLLDLSEEEAALCTYVCPSKLQLDVVLREGLDQYIRES